MSIQAAISRPRRRRISLSLRLPPWPLHLGRLLLKGMQAYSDNACLPYTMMLGGGPNGKPAARDRDRI